VSASHIKVREKHTLRESVGILPLPMHHHPRKIEIPCPGKAAY